MPRPLRILGEGIHYHLILRCNNRESLLQKRVDFELLLQLFEEAKSKFRCRIYNYDFLNTHIHLMLSTHQNCFVDQIMHYVCFKYANDYNKRHQRSGHFWAHRYRSRVILNDSYGLACLRYQHRNVLSLGLVDKPEDWQWSGYNYYAFGASNPLLEYHPSYLSLSEDNFERMKFYRNIVNTSIPSDTLKGLLEKGSGKPTVRFSRMVKQIDQLRFTLK